jgi:RNA polymerase sigma-70 factor (ECF subfamily)
LKCALVICPERPVAEPSEAFAALLARAREGDSAAVAELVGRYESRVWLVARVLLGPALQPHLDSMDLVQSVHRSLLLGVCRGKFAVPTPEERVALATTMVRRKVARKWRHLRRQRRLESWPADAGPLPELLLSLHSTDPDPAQAGQFNDAVRQLCGGLDATRRRLVELRLDGHTTAEIAAELGLSGVAVRVALTRLRQQLRASGVFGDWL